MKIFRNKDSLVKYINELKKEGASLGFVPTMGSLHRGHLSLVERALTENDNVICSIFINPAQFNNKSDFEQYPSNLKRDLNLLESMNCSAVFTPSKSEMYPQGITVEKSELGSEVTKMEGRFRPGHFQGVATIVKRLTEIVMPHSAYYGEKDYQQLIMVKNLMKTLNLPTEIIGCPTMREENGLAMSSRNERLTQRQRQEAGFIYRSLIKARQMAETLSPQEIEKSIRADFDQNDFLKLEYFNILHNDTLESISDFSKGTARAFVAAYMGEVRLIDNMKLN